MTPSYAQAYTDTLSAQKAALTATAAALATCLTALQAEADSLVETGGPASQAKSTILGAISMTQNYANTISGTLTQFTT